MVDYVTVVTCIPNDGRAHYIVGVWRYYTDAESWIIHHGENDAKYSIKTERVL